MPRASVGGGKAKTKAKAKAAQAALAASDGGGSTKRPLFDQAEENEMPKSSPGSVGARIRSTDEQVHKCLRDNFSLYPKAQTTMLLNAEGMSLVEVLRRDRELINTKATNAPVLGKIYYQRLREEFSYSDSPSKRLRVANSEQLIGEDLMKALEELNKHPKNYERAMDWLESASMVNQKSLVLLLKQALAFNPSGGAEVVNFLLGVLKYCSKHEVHKNFAQEWSAIREHLDEALVKSLTTWKAANMKAKVWWDMNRGIMSAMLSVEDCDKCMLADENLKSVETELCTVVQSSAIGGKLFGSVHRQYQGGKISSLIKDMLGSLCKKDITMPRILEYRTQFVTEAEKRGKDVKESQPKRTVELTYRGVPFAIVVHSFYDEYLMAECSMVESAAVQQGVLEGFFCEHQLVPSDQQASVPKVDAEVVMNSAKVRKAAQAAVVSEAPAGEVIISCLQNNMAQFMQIHRGFRVMWAFWQSVVGQGSEKRLQLEVLKCLGSECQRVTLEEAIASMEELARSKLISFCGLGLSNLFQSCKSFLLDIKQNRCPKYDGSNDSAFLKKIMKQVAEFYTFEESAGSGGEAKKLYGTEAMEAKLTQLEEKAETDKVNMHDLTGLKVYSWALPEERRQVVDAMIDECVKADVVGAAERAMHEYSSAQPKARSGRKKLATNARDAVLKLLG